MTYTVLRCLLILLLGCGLALAGYAASKRSKGAGIGLAALGLLAVLFHYADPRWSLDEHVWLPGGIWRDLLYAPGALLVGAALGLAREKPRQRVLTALLAVGYAGFLLHDPIYVLISARQNLGPPTVEEGVVLQRNGVNCVPASAATVLRLWGVDTDDGQLALRAQTSYYGTSTHRIVAAVDAIAGEQGLQARPLRTTWKELRALGHPCLLLVKLLDTTPHAVAVVGLSATHVRVAEPAAGLQTFEPVWFERWKSWEGEAILIGRDFDHAFEVGDVDPRIASLRPGLKATSAEPERFDPALADAVRAFQEAHGLPVTGAIGPRTILALDARNPARQVPSLSLPSSEAPESAKLPAGE